MSSSVLRLTNGMLSVLALGFLAWGAPALALAQRNPWSAAIQSSDGEGVVCSQLARTGKPCMGCGGTRSIGLAAQGRFTAAAAANPLGAWVGLVCWAGALAGIAGVVRPSRRLLLGYLGAVVGSAPLAFVFNGCLWWSRYYP